MLMLMLMNLVRGQIFHAMMMKNFVETNTNKMELTEFDQETVEGFLDYIYAEHELVLDQDMYKRTFDKKRLTAELLRFCHRYDVKNLLEKCMEHLKKNVDDVNAVEVWTVAEAIGHEELKKVALEYLGKKKWMGLGSHSSPLNLWKVCSIT